jgi:hypothetical protein
LLTLFCHRRRRSDLQGNLGSLKTLDLSYSGVKDSHIGRLTQLPALQELNLDSCPISDLAISYLADNNVAPNLTCLDLADTDLTDAGMAKIAKFVKLEKLSLFYCKITNSGLRHISQLKSIQVLNLDSRDISDDGLRYLRNLNNLKALDIFSGRISDTGCIHISAISSLESLELCGGGIGDLGCTQIAKLSNLRCLNLSQNDRITNRGAAALGALGNLKTLNLSNTRVNASALRFFGGLVKLQSLALYGCRGIEEAGLGKLQDDLPNLKCLRINSAAEHDGMVLSDSDEEDSNSGWSDHFHPDIGAVDMDEGDVYSDYD